MSAVKHLTAANGGKITELMHEKDGEPACSRVPGHVSTLIAMDMVLRARAAAKEVKYVQH